MLSGGCSNFQTPAKPASDWLKSQLLIGSKASFSLVKKNRGRYLPAEYMRRTSKLCKSYKARIKLYQSPAKALHEAPYEAPQKLYQKLYQRLCSTSAHPVY